MKALAAAALGLLVALGLTAPANAQDCYPECPAPTVVSGSFTPGGAGSLTFADLSPNVGYGGTVFSTPIPLPLTAADSTGVVSFTFAVPADFALDALHEVHLTQDGVIVLQATFGVDASGRLVPPATITDTTTATTDSRRRAGPGAIPRTGMEGAAEVLRVGLAAIAAGAVLAGVGRRRKAHATR